eukprot:TRINITY_DN788_c0_g3_i2.p1 TRINITY_DN788_c0_g3~~TRINITY_DN788_c0_g3_i2.p1  ORF type:complete len:112 (-),score=11.80 TRINITY_DN788_c0_g3_i2:121-432(-)
MIRRPPRSTHCISSAASDVYKRQLLSLSNWVWISCEHFFKFFTDLLALHLTTELTFVLFSVDISFCIVLYLLNNTLSFSFDLFYSFLMLKLHEQLLAKFLHHP